MMTPTAMKAHGLTFDEIETGVIADVYCFPGKPRVYLTAAEYAEVRRREDRQKRGQEAVDLEALGATIRGARSKRRVVHGRKVG